MTQIRMVKIGDRSADHNNNFNLLRMLAASGVLVSHAYPISLGPGTIEPLVILLNGKSLGGLCVMIFFAISGFFITRSFDGKSSLISFLQARALRLFPALMMVLAVTVIAGAVLTTASAAVYWRAVPEYYLRNLSLFFLQYGLPGVFGDNPYGTPINGSLWTLSYEVLCYLGVVICGLLGLFRRPVLFGIAMVGFAVLYGVTMVVEVNGRIDALMILALPFSIGMSFWVWRDRIPLSFILAIALGGVAALFSATPVFMPLLTVAVSYTVFVLGYARLPMIDAYNKLGDYSYGTYVYAFPIQQIVASFGVVLPLWNMAISFPLTLLCAVLSWHLVEAQALKWKRSAPRSRTAAQNPAE